MQKGFTLAEVLAVLVVIGILTILTIPAYSTILINLRRENSNSKIKNMEVAANKYGEKIKDEIKDMGAECYSQSISDLIKKGYLISESDYDNVINNPVTNTFFTGQIKTCYCENTYEIASYYVEDFNPSVVYHADDKVLLDDKIYICKNDYPGNNQGINATYYDKNKRRNIRYFDEITC